MGLPFISLKIPQLSRKEGVILGCFLLFSNTAGWIWARSGMLDRHVAFTFVLDYFNMLSWTRCWISPGFHSPQSLECSWFYHKFSISYCPYLRLLLLMPCNTLTSREHRFGPPTALSSLDPRVLPGTLRYLVTITLLWKKERKKEKYITHLL